MNQTLWAAAVCAHFYATLMNKGKCPVNEQL